MYIWKVLYKNLKTQEERTLLFPSSTLENSIEKAIELARRHETILLMEKQNEWIS
jgi:hypothetical protein